MTGRSYDLGLAQGRFLRTLAERLDADDCLEWLERDHFLEPAAAKNLRFFVRRQLLKTGVVPTERTLVVEASRDPLGDWQVLLLSPLGNRLHFGLRLALENVLRRRLGYRPQCLHHDDGVLVRLTESDEPVLDLFEGLTAESVRDQVLEELGDSALFALRFRQNAARALMMPGGAPGKRSPLWLQRLRGRDLLQVARRYPDFPIVAETFRECLHDHLDLTHLEQLLRDVHSGAVQVHASRLDAPSPFAANVLFAFTAAYMYQFDSVQGESTQTQARLDHELLDQLIGHDGEALQLDPRAIQQVDRRLRGVGQPPRSPAEMAEWLRRVGDASAGDLEGEMVDFVRSLEAEGVVARIELARVREPWRWVLTEEAELYRAVFGAGADGAEAHTSAATILFRFLQTHALVGLADVLERYPFELAWAQRQLEEWGRGGRLVRVTLPEQPDVLQWSAPGNLEQVQRGTLSILRREVVPCAAPQWADFVARWQYAHPSAQRPSAAGLAEVLERLQGVALPLDHWEQHTLPARVRGYEPRWLDDVLAAGRWAWLYRGEQLAFVERASLAEMPGPDPADLVLDAPSEAVLEALRSRGAQFVAELAEGGSIPATRAVLWSLLRQGLVTNDRLDVLRRGEPPRPDEEPRLRSRGEVRAYLRQSTRRHDPAWPEGRWSRLAWGRPDVERSAFFQARLLLQRYGIVARELALLDPAMPPWRVLYEVLSRMELAGEVRRGYFVEGLSGAQFALSAAAEQLHELSLPSTAQAPMILLHSLDPANVYGSAAPLDLTLLADGTRSFLRRTGNWLVLHAGRPVLLIEQQGKRLTALPSAGADELRRAVACLPEMLGPRRDPRHKLVVETWNEQPVTASAGKELLEQAGFVRDYQALTLYDAWR